jgi:hypothetical protein
MNSARRPARRRILQFSPILQDAIFAAAAMVQYFLRKTAVAVRESSERFSRVRTCICFSGMRPDIFFEKACLGFFQGRTQMRA